MVPVPTELYTLSLHDALPISGIGTGDEQRSLAGAHREIEWHDVRALREQQGMAAVPNVEPDRKSTRLNSSHTVISYAVFCLKKKKTFTRILWIETRSRCTDKA